MGSGTEERGSGSLCCPKPVVKDWGCIRKHSLGGLSRLALNSCSSLFYVAACLCVGGREKENTGDCL